MNIFGTDFIERLRESIISIIQETVNVLVANSSEEQRFLNKKQAIKYIGGMNYKDFDVLINMGLPTIIINRPGGSQSIRFDKKDLDVFMVEHKTKQ